MEASFDACRNQLISTVQQMVSESGDPVGFGASAWVDN